MQIEHLKGFLAIVAGGSFTEAAQMLFSTQANLSKHIQALEKELDVSLFSRERRRVQLTEAGRALIPHAERLLNDYNAMLAALDELKSDENRCMRIGSIPVMAQYGIASMISAFRKAHPEIRMTVDEREGSDLLSALDEGQYEIVFLRDGPRVGGNPKYRTAPICEDRLVALLPHTHPLAGRGAVSLPELAGDDFLLLEWRTMLYDFCIRECKKAGFTPRVVYTGTRIENIIEMVSQGMGISLLMERPASYIAPKDAVLIPLQEHITSNILIVRQRRRRASSTTESFWKFVMTSRQ